MKVAELIQKLQSFPQDARVSIIIATSSENSEYADDINHVELSKETGEVEIRSDYERESFSFDLPPPGSC